MNDHPKWKFLRRGEAIDLKLFKARFDWYVNLRNGLEVKMVAVDSKDAVNVVAMTPSGKMVMVRQFRFGIEADTLELPGGLVDEGETPEFAAKRELLEETGYSGGTWKFLHTIQSNPVFMNNRIYQFLAVGVEKTAALSLDEGENIEVLEMTLDELKAAYRTELLRHPHTLTALTKVFDLWEKESVPGL
jgi:8-oxo-dGTP pyrophosphatase MutT (NUDIX family)